MLALWLLAPLVLLGRGVVVELIVVPRGRCGCRGSSGTNSLPLPDDDPADGDRRRSAALILRCARARRAIPALTGALAGAAAAGLAATIYATHCPDNSPLFVATWYPLATLVVRRRRRAGRAALSAWW